MADIIPKVPTNLKEMVDVASKLSKDFAYVRVDLYDANGKIYFGEMTFTSGNGYEKTQPKSFAYELGNYVHFDEQ